MKRRLCISAKFDSVEKILARARSSIGRQRMIIADGCYRSFIAALIAVAGRPLTFNMRNLNDLRAAIAIQSFSWWVIRTSLFSSHKPVVERIKSWSQTARRWALTAPKGKVFASLGLPFLGNLANCKILSSLRTSAGLLQFSYCGRSLPEADQPKCLSDLRAMRDRLTSPGVTPAPRLEFIEAWVERWTYRHLPVYRNVPVPLSAGSTNSSTRAKGGLTADVAKRYMELKPSTDPVGSRRMKDFFYLQVYGDGSDDFGGQSSTATQKKTPGLGNYATFLSQWGPNWGAYAFVMDAVRRELDKTELPAHKAVSVAERGWKTRGVSKNDPDLVVAVDVCRRLVFSSLRKDRRISEALDGDVMAALLSMGGEDVVPLPAIGLAADMSVATDGLHHDAYLMVWRTYCRVCCLPEDVLRIGERALGPQLLSFPWGEVVESTRGALMGLPLSWAIMCLLNLCAWDFGRTHNPKPENRNLRKYPAPVRILGDDLAGICHPAVADAYESFIISIGGSFNAKAHFRSERGMVFAERCCTLRIVPVPTRQMIAPIDPSGVPLMSDEAWPDLLRSDKLKVIVNTNNVNDNNENKLSPIRKPVEPRSGSIYREALLKPRGFSTPGVPLSWTPYGRSRNMRFVICEDSGMGANLPPQSTSDVSARKRVAMLGLTIGVPYETFAVRGLVAPRSSSDWAPWWSTLGDAQYSALRSAPNRASAIIAVTKFTAGDLLSTARRGAIPMYLPRPLGGLGYLHPRGWDLPVHKAASESVRRALAVYLYGLRPGEKPPVSPKAAYLWLVPGQWRSQGMKVADEALDHRYVLSTIPDGGLPDKEGLAPGTVPVGLYDLHEDLIQYYSRVFTLSKGVENPKRFSPSYSKVVTHLGKAYKQLRLRGATPHPVGGAGSGPFNPNPTTIADLVEQLHLNERRFAATLVDDYADIQFDHSAMNRAVGWLDFFGEGPPKAIRVLSRGVDRKRRKARTALPLTGPQIYAQYTREERRNRQLIARDNRAELPPFKPPVRPKLD